MTIRIAKLTILAVLLSAAAVCAQQDQSSTRIHMDKLQPTKLIDCPTAGLLPRGSFDFDIKVYPQGGLIFRLDIGLMKRFMVGMSFGGENVIGDGEPDWNPRIEFAAKYRLINESWSFPALDRFRFSRFGSF